MAIEFNRKSKYKKEIESLSGEVYHLHKEYYDMIKTRNYCSEIIKMLKEVENDKHDEMDKKIQFIRQLKYSFNYMKFPLI